jgi:hypothetical protein
MKSNRQTVNWSDRGELLISSAVKLIGHKYNTDNQAELNTYGLGNKMESWQHDL